MKEAVLLLLVVVLIGCSHITRPSHAPISVQEAMTRESSGLVEQTVISQDNELEFKVKGRSTPVVQVFKEQIPFHHTSIDIGSQTPIECLFYKSEISPAVSLKNLSDRILDDKKSVGNVVEKRTSMFGAGAIEGHPYLLLQTAFAVDDNGSKLAGNLKAMVASKDVGSVLCFHNEVGYQQTFAERFTELVTSYKFSQVPAPKVQYKDVMLLTINNLPIGYSANYVTDGEFETKGWVQKTSALMPNPAGDAFTMDDLKLEVSNREGVVAYGLYKSEENGQLKHGIELKTEDGKNYRVQGVKDGKKIETMMQTYEGVTSNYMHTKMLPKKLFEQNLQFFSVPMYMPSKDPFTPVRLKTSLKKSNEKGAIVRFDDGNSSFVAVVGEDGSTEAVRVPAGQMEIEGKKIFSSGSLKKD